MYIENHLNFGVQINTGTMSNTPKPVPKIELAYKTLFPTKYKNKQPRQKHLQKSKPKCFLKCITRCQKKPPSSKVWRRTIVVIKPKAKKKLPRLFRVDDSTGLPVDYERTVARIMSYVNPQLNKAPSSDAKVAQMLARTVLDIMGKSKGHIRCPHDIKQQMQMIFKHHTVKESKEKLQHDSDLNKFHCACKRKPSPISDEQIPTYNSRFNYNRLKIKSCP